MVALVNENSYGERDTLGVMNKAKGAANIMSALVKLYSAWNQNRYVCVGLDLDVSRIPGCLRPELPAFERLSRFAELIILATAPAAAAYKLNLQFYEDDNGRRLLAETAFLVRTFVPEALLIADSKDGDIGNTNDQKAAYLYGNLKVDAVTLCPYVGEAALQPFLREDKLAFILCRTSNEGADEFQNLALKGGKRLYEHVAKRVANHWGNGQNVGLVVGATAVDELTQVREIAPNLPILIPGVGAQGGDLEAAVRAGRFASQPSGISGGFIVNSSRDLLYGPKGQERGRDFDDVAGAYASNLNNKIVQALASK